MRNLWNDGEAKAYTGELGLRVYSSRLLGRDRSLVVRTTPLDWVSSPYDSTPRKSISMGMVICRHRSAVACTLCRPRSCSRYPWQARFTISTWSYFSIAYQKTYLQDEVVSQTERLGNTIKLGTHYSMMLNSRDDINQILALALYHLKHNRGWTGAVVRTVPTSHQVDAVAELLARDLKGQSLDFVVRHRLSSPKPDPESRTPGTERQIPATHSAHRSEH